MPLATLTRETMPHYPDDHYHVVDNMWTHASADEGREVQEEHTFLDDGVAASSSLVVCGEAAL